MRRVPPRQQSEQPGDPGAAAQCVRDRLYVPLLGAVAHAGAISVHVRLAAGEQIDPDGREVQSGRDRESERAVDAGIDVDQIARATRLEELHLEDAAPFELGEQARDASLERVVARDRLGVRADADVDRPDAPCELMRRAHEPPLPGDAADGCEASVEIRLHEDVVAGDAGERRGEGALVSGPLRRPMRERFSFADVRALGLDDHRIADLGRGRRRARPVDPSCRRRLEARCDREAGERRTCRSPAPPPRGRVPPAIAGVTLPALRASTASAAPSRGGRRRGECARKPPPGMR